MEVEDLGMGREPFREEDLKKADLRCDSEVEEEEGKNLLASSGSMPGTNRKPR